MVKIIYYYQRLLLINKNTELRDRVCTGYIQILKISGCLKDIILGITWDIRVPTLLQDN